jgi:hypothetical protein
MFRTTMVSYLVDGEWVERQRYVDVMYCWGTSGGWGGPPDASAGPGAGMPQFCKELAELGITAENYLRMVADMGLARMNYSQPPSQGVMYNEFGHSFFAGGHYDGRPSDNPYDYSFGSGIWAETILNRAIELPFDKNNPIGGYTFHIHQYLPGWEGVGPDGKPMPLRNLGSPSEGDFEHAGKLPGMQHFLAWENGFMWYDASGAVSNLAGLGWDELHCEKYLPSHAQDK